MYTSIFSISSIKMLSCSWLLCSIISFFLVESFQFRLTSSQQFFSENRKWYPGSGNCQAVLVDQSGYGNFSTVQSAIDSVPSNNQYWVCIFINPGTYSEKVKIPYDKPYLVLKGKSRKTTQIVWGDHDSTAQSPTFMSLADNIVVRNIHLVNSYNYPNNDNQRLPAVAAMITGDKCAFYRCGFSSLQDTLWDDQGRHYFKHCNIEGSVDFIFGSGQSLYEKCNIHVLGEGFITAQGRTNPDDGNGFVFKRCQVYGYGPVYLGRPWREYARVLFYRSRISNDIYPEGWDAWNFVGREDHITFAEYGNYGPGANTSGRVWWEKNLSSSALKELTSKSFIDQENWINKQPS